jgi:hypothetical protein
MTAAGPVLAAAEPGWTQPEPPAALAEWAPAPVLAAEPEPVAQPEAAIELEQACLVPAQGVRPASGRLPTSLPEERLPQLPEAECPFVSAGAHVARARRLSPAPLSYARRKLRII